MKKVIHVNFKAKSRAKKLKTDMKAALLRGFTLAAVAAFLFAGWSLFG